MTTAAMVDVLNRARDLIADPATWCQGGTGVKVINGRPAYCAAQAVWAIAGKADDVGHSAAGAIRRTIHAQILSEWNDAPERTHAEVLDAFDRTIARLVAS